jgi:signal transduction histidine kinase
LNDFITSNRSALLAITREKVVSRASEAPKAKLLSDGIPLFLDQLVDRLEGDRPSVGDIGVAANAHGGAMLHQGFSVAQVVQGYGDVCQAITELAVSKNALITTDEFRMLNRCLDVAMAEAVSEYEHQRDRATSSQETERLGTLTHELRNQLSTAVLAFDILTRGGVGIAGSTAAVLGRSLSRLRDTIDRTLAGVRVEAGIKAKERIGVHAFIEEVEVSAAFEASTKGVKLTAACSDDGTEVDMDRHVLASALGNILQNAIKFTRAGGTVALRTHTAAGRVLIDVEDECGGLPPGGAEALFRPYEQRGADRTGLGLGLGIARRGVEASGGAIHVRDLPGRGCVFTIDLPAAPPSV